MENGLEGKGSAGVCSAAGSAPAPEAEPSFSVVAAPVDKLPSSEMLLTETAHERKKDVRAS